MRRIEAILHRFKCSVADKAFPRWMYVEVTDRCNSRCRTCSIWKQTPCPNPMTPKDLRGVLSSELFRNVEYVGNSGGEPTLVDLYGFLQAEHEALPKAALSISSNGLLPDKLYEVVSRCVKEGMHLDVGLSLDGVGAFHDYWRGVKGNFERLDLVIRKLLQLQRVYPDLLNVGAGSTLTVETSKQADALADYCGRLGLPLMWHWFNFAPFYYNKPRQANAVLFERAILKIMDKTVYREMWLNYLHTAKFPHLKCHALSSFLLLNCDGTIRPCLTFWDHPAGNVLRHDPVRVWHSEKAEAVRQLVSNCAGCLNKWACDWNLIMAYPSFLAKKLIARLT